MWFWVKEKDENFILHIWENRDQIAFLYINFAISGEEFDVGALVVHTDVRMGKWSDPSESPMISREVCSARDAEVRVRSRVLAR